MLIGEISRKTGFSKDTIRFYERKGLIKIDKKERRNNNYKEYSSYVLDRLLTIQNLKEFGYTLNEIRELLESWDGGDFNCLDNKPKVEEKIRGIENQIKNLTRIKKSLQQSILTCPEDCEILNALTPLDSKSRQ